VTINVARSDDEAERQARGEDLTMGDTETAAESPEAAQPADEVEAAPADEATTAPSGGDEQPAPDNKPQSKKGAKRETRS
jgi:large subunit ribosomal protein L9